MNTNYFRDDFLETIAELQPKETDRLRVIINFVSSEKMDQFVNLLVSGLLQGEELNMSNAVRNILKESSESVPEHRKLLSISAVSLAEPLGVIMALSDRGEKLGIAPKGIEEDFEVTTMLDRSLPLIEVPPVWNRGFEGSGIVVAVIDTGLDEAHQDFSGRIKGQKDFSGEGTGDGHGHGTHVAGIIAGSGSQSTGKYKGVAPQAKILAAKVLTSDGRGTLSSVIAGVEWAVTDGAHVLNLSLGGKPTDGTDALSRSVNWAVDQGRVVCVAAGNSGPGAGTVGSPGVASKVITVGAVDDFDKVAQFSSRGPTPDGREKPDLLMPGVNIISSRASETSMGRPTGQKYTEASGTSMATPHAAGACALLLESRGKKISPEEVKTRLMETAKDLEYPKNTQGSGRCDVNKGVDLAEIKKPIITLHKVEMAKAQAMKPAEIARMQIWLKNSGTASAEDVTAHLISPYEQIFILHFRGDYGELEPGEDDRDTFLLETLDAEAGDSNLSCKVSYISETGKREQITLSIPLKVAPFEENGETGELEWKISRLYARHPELKGQARVTSFIQERQLGFWGEHRISENEQVVYIVDDSMATFLLATESYDRQMKSIEESGKLGVAVTMEAAVASAKKHVSGIFTGMNISLETSLVFPASTGEKDQNSRRPIWIIEQIAKGDTIRALFKVRIDARNGEILGWEENIFSQNIFRQFAFGDALFNVGSKQ